jgi:hypothetical protein
MEKHTIHTVDYDNNTYYCVFENSTEQVLDFFLIESEANKKKKFLDKGGAFDGFTPEFVLRKVNSYIDINNKFEEL